MGKQTSDKSEYEVQVELKHVDMTEAFLCGYLRIQGKLFLLKLSSSSQAAY